MDPLSIYKKIIDESMGVWLQYSQKQFHGEPKIPFSVARENIKEWGVAYSFLFPDADIFPENMMNIHSLGKKPHLRDTPEVIATHFVHHVQNDIQNHQGIWNRMDSAQRDWILKVVPCTMTTNVDFYPESPGL